MARDVNPIKKAEYKTATYSFTRNESRPSKSGCAHINIMSKQFLNDPFELEMGTKTFSHRLIYKDGSIKLISQTGGRFPSERSFTINKTHARKLIAGLKRDYPNIQTAKELLQATIGFDEDALIEACEKYDSFYEASISC